MKHAFWMIIISQILTGCVLDDASTEKKVNLSNYSEKKTTDHLSSRVEALENNSNGHALELAQHDQALLNLQGELLSHSQAITTLTLELSTTQSALQAVQSSVGSLQIQHQDHALQLFNLNQKLNNQALKIEALESGITKSLEGIVARLEKLEHKLAPIERMNIQGKPSLVITGVNVHLRNGRNHSYAKNGVGNLIVGYDEESQEGNHRKGSHNVVVGPELSYPSAAEILSNPKTDEPTRSLSETIDQAP